MSTTYLALENDWEAGQTVPATYLDAVSNYLEALFFGVASITHDDTANYTPAAADTRKPVLVIGGTLTAARNLVLETATRAPFLLYNNTGQTLTVKTSGGTGIDVPTGTTTWLRCDGTNILRAGHQLLSGTTTWDPASVADGAVVNTTVTVTGAAVGDPAYASLSTVTVANVILGAVVTAANTVSVTLHNKTGAAYDAASGTLKAVVFKG